MKPFISTIRVSYSDTDQMGIVHHSNYLKYYETARWDLFRQAGALYKSLEEEGFLLPVVNMQIQFLKPAFYDEELTIETLLVESKGARLMIDHKLYNEKHELINRAAVTLAFISTTSRNACRPPEFVQRMINVSAETD